MDLQKAFDTVSHHQLLLTLVNRFGCSPHVVSMIKSFLQNRQQRVRIPSCDTPFNDISSGVPQGSILGPLLFILFLDDIPNFNETKCVMYADDISLIHKFEDIKNCKLQPIVDSLSDWVCKKRLAINVCKTKVMFLSRKSCNASYPDIFINGVPIEVVTSVKILGVIFSNNLRWSEQFSSLYAKCCRAMSYVKKLKSNGNCNDVIMQAFFGIVFCHIVYCWPIMCDLNRKDFKKLEILYKTACRWANLTHHNSLRDLLDRCCVKIIKSICIHKDCHPLSQFFVLRDSKHDIRHSRALLPLRRNSSLYYNSFVRFSSRS